VYGKILTNYTLADDVDPHLHVMYNVAYRMLCLQPDVRHTPAGHRLRSHRLPQWSAQRRQGQLGVPRAVPSLQGMSELRSEIIKSGFAAIRNFCADLGRR
jgi:hypothetical protein